MERRDAQAVNDKIERRSVILDFTREGADDAELYTFPLSSEKPYRRWRGEEVLVHKADAVDLSFLNSGAAPLLFQHDSRGKQIGVVTKAWLDEKKKRVYVTVRFSRSAHAQEVKQDVDDGIMKNVSVGYNVLKTETTEDGTATTKSYRVTLWKPMEASIVSIPADDSVGVGRSNQPQETSAMEPEEQQNRAGGGLPPAAPAAPVNVMSNEARNAEIAASMAEINALAAMHNRSDDAQKFIGDAIRAGKIPSLAEYRGKLRQDLPDDVPLVNSDVGLTNNETRQFSIVKLARSMANGATGVDIEGARFELEACEAAARNFDGNTNGHRLPEELMRSWSKFDVDGVSSEQLQQRAAMSTTIHTDVQAVDHMAERFIENLRNASSIMRAGITVLSGLSGNIEIPGADTNAAAAWLASEGANAAETVPTFRKVEMAVKDIAGYTDLTRRMLQQTTISIEAYVRSELVTAVALGIDLGGLSGSGSSGIPTGLKNTSGIGSVTFASLGAPTRAEVIEMWSDVASGNAAIGNLAFLSNALMVAHFMNGKVDAGSGKFMMDGPNSPLLSTTHILSNQVANNDLYYGNWSDMLMGMWGGLDLDRDNAALFLSGGIRLRAIQSVDFGVRRVGSFCLGNGGS